MMYVFKKLTNKEAEYIIDCIDEVFGYRKMIYNKDEKILEFERPINFPEAPEIYFIGAGMIFDLDSSEVSMKFKMYNKEEDYTYYIDGIEV